MLGAKPRLRQLGERRVLATPVQRPVAPTSATVIAEHPLGRVAAPITAFLSAPLFCVFFGFYYKGNRDGFEFFTTKDVGNGHKRPIFLPIF